jgi:penicillin-binding protein 1B
MLTRVPPARRLRAFASALGYRITGARSVLRRLVASLRARGLRGTAVKIAQRISSRGAEPVKLAQLYQFLASGGRMQPLRAVRGVLDPKGASLNRYDNPSKPAEEGDAIAARLVTIALQGAVTGGTARPLLSDGLGGLSPAGKTGTSNDSRDSWFAGYTGDHLAVVWVGNDDNEPTGLYGATGAMRVWSSLFRELPSAPLQVGSQGIEWAWLDATEFATTEEDCPGARRAAFVAGYLPPEHRSCQSSSWLDWFNLGGDNGQEEPPPPPPQDPQLP